MKWVLGSLLISDLCRSMGAFSSFIQFKNIQHMYWETPMCEAPRQALWRQKGKKQTWPLTSWGLYNRKNSTIFPLTWNSFSDSYGKNKHLSISKFLLSIESIPFPNT